MSIDQYVANKIFSAHSLLVYNWIAWIISLSVFVLLLCAAYYWYFIKKDKRFVLRLIVCSISLYVIIQIIKFATARPRPNLEDYLSFPSSHATFAFFLAAVLPVKRQVRVALFAWAVLVAFCRLWLGLHWLSDIFAGALIGLAAAWAFKHATDKPS